MDIGNHYIALSVKNIVASREFYEKLGFRAMENCGSVEDKWMMMHHGKVTIGLYQDMFPKNCITFNPQDARAFYQLAKENNLKLEYISASIEQEKGPCHFSLFDPDGNPVLFDQHNE